MSVSVIGFFCVTTLLGDAHKHTLRPSPSFQSIDLRRLIDTKFQSLCTSLKTLSGRVFEARKTLYDFSDSEMDWSQHGENVG